MAVNRASVLRNKELQKFSQSGFLCGRAGVARIAVLVEATDIAHSDGVGVVANTVCAGSAHITAFLNGAIKAHNIVITDVRPVFIINMVFSKLLDTDIDFWF